MVASTTRRRRTLFTESLGYRRIVGQSARRLPWSRV